MYYNYGRNKFISRPYGYSWPYSHQPNFESYMHQYPAYPSYPHANYQMPNRPVSYNNIYPYSPYPTPYPQDDTTPQPPTGFQSIFSQFKEKDGTYDINKLMDTAGHMVGAVNQVSSLVKGISSTFKV